MRALGAEATEVARHCGVELSFDVAWSALRETLARTATNRSSMLQDVEAGRATEIDAIAKSLLDLAPPNLDLPHIRTVHALIASLEPRP